MRDTFTVAQDLTLREYYGLSLSEAYRNKLVRRMFVYITCIGLLAGLTGLLAPGGNVSIGIGNFSGVVIAPVVFSLFILVTGFLISFFVSLLRPDIIRGISYRFTHWGMERTGTRNESTIPWRDFTGVRETKSFFLLYAVTDRRRNMYVIQKRMLAGTEEAAEFRAFLEQHLPLG